MPESSENYVPQNFVQECFITLHLMIMCVNPFRECIIPDVCRTFHFSKSGAHISAVLQKRLFEIHSFNRHPNFHQLQTTRYTCCK